MILRSYRIPVEERSELYVAVRSLKNTRVRFDVVFSDSSMQQHLTS